MAMSYFPPTMSELRARSAALDNPLLRLCLKCFAFGVDELGVIELDAYMHEALIPPPALMTVLAQALWELEEFG